MMKTRKLLCAAAIITAIAAVFALVSCPQTTDGNFGGEIRGYSRPGKNAPFPAPGNVRARDDGRGGIALSWDGVEGADGYTVYRSTAASSPSRRGGAGKSAFTDTGKSVNPGTPYVYFVSAYRGEAESAMAEASPKPVALEGGDPSLLAAPEITGARVNEGAAGVTLTWTAVPGAEEYRIYRSSSYDDRQYIFKHENAATSYTDSGLAPGDYTYRVSAVNAARGEGYLSRESDAVTIVPEPGAPDAPDAVLNLRARVEGGDTPAIALVWDAAAAATIYRVYRSEDGETYAETGFADGDVSYTDSMNAQHPIEWGGSYYYRVKSYNGNREGYLSKPCGPVVLKPAAPVITGVTGRAGNVAV
ncbi:MAG: hypothetical protein LBG76_07470, partial [Treponema sp.]|nr:hypothetical protein [Treponema sp.]